MLLDPGLLPGKTGVLRFSAQAVSSDSTPRMRLLRFRSCPVAYSVGCPPDFRSKMSKRPKLSTPIACPQRKPRIAPGPLEQKGRLLRYSDRRCYSCRVLEKQRVALGWHAIPPERETLPRRCCGPKQLSLGVSEGGDVAPDSKSISNRHYQTPGDRWSPASKLSILYGDYPRRDAR